jgi:hypothetical protein
VASICIEKKQGEMMFSNKLLISIFVVVIGCSFIGGCSEGDKEKPAPAAGQLKQTVPQAQPAGAKASAMGCYEVGLRTGRCAAKMMSGLPCDPADEITVPPSCKDTPDMEKGLSDGRKSVY